MKVTATGVIALFSIVLTCFGFLLGTTALSQSFSGIKWTDIIAAVGSILAGVGTIIGVFVAFYVGGQWRKQNKVSSFTAYYETLLKLLDCTVEQGTILMNRVIEDYPHDLEFSNYERERMSHLSRTFDELMSSIISEYAKLELLYQVDDVAPLNPISLREQIGKYRAVQYVYRPHEVDQAEYEKNVNREFQDLKSVFNRHKQHVKTVINKT
ncbi:hypothetical protein [Vibrio sp. 1F169]|uniref:hypothetical protein n=1 Tax=Vibrio TaxID=662 RepID=UPI002A6D6A55|nr:hypothetical protein VCRA2113O415_490016 [Vibrio crassostreae]CAK2875393.1 hypothetical protein VCRA2113O420_450016 [Vibrio crassostreae]CAK3484078.1 hypothetical protein VCRA2121O436_440006 [Vibrio crassostreae]